MAGDWIKLQHATPNKPEVHRLARLLGVSRGDAFLLVVEWWIWLDVNSCNGLVTQMYANDVDAVMRCPGFAHAMRSVGWLEIADDQAIGATPHFERHNGKTAKNRALTNDRVANARAKNRNDSVTQLPLQNRIPEKRREEVKTLRPVEPDEFGRFWLAWPLSERKVAKARCREVWKQKGLDAMAAKIIAHVAALRETDTWQRGYAPSPLTYLKQRRWEDDPVAPAEQVVAWK